MIKRLIILLQKLLFASLFMINQAHAQHEAHHYFRNYWNPLYHGERLAYCSPDGRECGLPVAHRYCRFMGYERASRQIIDYNVGLTHFLGTAQQCKGWTCNGFMLIRCVSTMKHHHQIYNYRSREFVLPRYHHERVAWCYKSNQRCGKRAAFSFCRRMGYMREQNFVKQAHVLVTREIGDQKLCFGKHCEGFRSITCYR